MSKLSNRFIVGAAAIIAVVVVMLHALDVPNFMGATSLQRESLHIPGFTGLTICFLLLLRSRFSAPTAYKATLLFTILLAIFSEAVQLIGPRDADLVDLFRDALGMVIGLAIAVSFDQTARSVLTKRQFRLLLITGVTAALMSIAPIINERYVGYRREAAMPILISFDHSWETSFFGAYGGANIRTISAPTEWPIAKGSVLKISFASTRYSGIQIDPHPDWSGYDSFSFWVASIDGQEHEIGFRIHDQKHNSNEEDRFNRRLLVGPTPTRFKVTMTEIAEEIEGREFDFSRIAAVMLFKANASGDETIIVDQFRLHEERLVTERKMPNSLIAKEYQSRRVSEAIHR